jgi:hypothetical protein
MYIIYVIWAEMLSLSNGFNVDVEYTVYIPGTLETYSFEH